MFYSKKNKKQLLLLSLLVAVTFLLRLIFLSDMEYKTDEKATVPFITQAFQSSFQPLAPLSAHSGTHNSSGFFYLAQVLSLGSKDPLAIATGIAVFNSLILAILLYLCRHSKKLLMTFAFCATGFNLVVASRKIWAPNLVVPFDCVALLLIAYGIKAQKRLDGIILLGIAGFSLVIAGHSYLAAWGVSTVVAFTLFLFLVFQRRYRHLNIGWISGLALGGATFIPFLWETFQLRWGSHAQESFYRQFLGLTDIRDLCVTVLSLPSSLSVYNSFIDPVKRELWQNHPSFILELTYFFLFLSILLHLILYWSSLVHVFHHWKSALREPLVVSTLGCLMTIPWILFYSGLGCHIHYWLGVIPFTYYLIAWVIEQNSKTRWGKVLEGLAWSSCVVTSISVLCFYSLVHQMGGLPGEYGPSYRLQVTSAATGSH